VTGQRLLKILREIDLQIWLPEGDIGMKVLRAWLVRLAGMFSRKQSESEFADELDSHLQMHIDDNLRAGMTAKQARRDAILKLGGVESTAQAYRERGTVPLLENLLLDIRFAI
jgi:hypothetical protein